MVKSYDLEPCGNKHCDVHNTCQRFQSGADEINCGESIFFDHYIPTPRSKRIIRKYIMTAIILALAINLALGGVIWGTIETAWGAMVGLGFTIGLNFGIFYVFISGLKIELS